MVAASILAMAWPGAAARPGSLSVTHWARALQPGDVVVVSISSPVALVSVEGVAFGQPLRAFPSGRPGSWQALAGIDLGTSPGRKSITISAKTEDGETLKTAYPLTVIRKTFPTRRLIVAPRFVSPPPEAGLRIDSERKKVAALLAEVTPARLWTDPFVQPVDGAVVSGFGARSVFNGRIVSAHRGADCSAPIGTPVRAPNAGRVALAEDLYFSGATIIIDHGLGVFSLLAHLSRVDVTVGETVARGAVVGEVGATGRVTGPHLHWTIRMGSAVVDPESFLQATAEGHLGQKPPAIFSSNRGWID